MITVTPGQIADFLATPAWNCMVEKIQYMLNNEIDRNLENPDPFTHGRAVGARKTCQVILSLPDIMKQEWEKSRAQK